jgi:hypothetical protein
LIAMERRWKEKNDTARLVHVPKLYAELDLEPGRPLPSGQKGC